jgi:hypothetical protein
MMQKDKVRTDLHNWVISQLRMGVGLHLVTQALIIESQRLHEAVDVVEAIREHDLKP